MTVKYLGNMSMTHENQRKEDEQEIGSPRASCHSLSLTRAAAQQCNMQQCNNATMQQRRNTEMQL